MVAAAVGCVFFIMVGIYWALLSLAYGSVHGSDTIALGWGTMHGAPMILGAWILLGLGGRCRVSTNWMECFRIIQAMSWIACWIILMDS